MKRIIRLTERDLTRIVRRVIREQEVGTAVQPDPTDGEWELIRDWLIENMNGEEVPLGDTERYAVHMKAAPNRPRPYYIINYDGMVREINKTPMDASSIMSMIDNKSDELTRFAPLSKTNFNDFINSMKNLFKTNPYLQDAYPNVAKKWLRSATLSDVDLTHYKILLKTPDEDGFTYYVYNPGTGKILGDGKSGAVVLNYQENKTKDEVLRFLNKNGIKTK